MRTNITISLDPKFIERMDAKRGAMPRSRWLEAMVDPELAGPVINAVSAASIAAEAVPARSPEPQGEPDEIPELDKWGNPVGTPYDETDPRSWT